MLKRAATCDPDDMIGNALRGSQNGLTYQFMLDSDPDNRWA